MSRAKQGRSKLLSLLLVLSMLPVVTACGASQRAVPPAEAPAAALSAAVPPAFSDVPQDAWYAEAVDYCRRNGIMSGVSDTSFAPESTLTRSMLVTVLYLLSGCPTVSDASGFRDVEPGAWYSDAVAWAAGSGLVSGYGSGVFGVDDPATREQAVTVLWKYAGQPEGGSAPDIVDCSDISDWAREAVCWAVSNEITDGMLPDRRFDPKADIKRGEAAAMLYHYLDKVRDESSRGKILVAYFSATGTTRPLAEYAADILNADLYEIIPAVPYTDADLAYYTNGRADREQNDPSARPAVSGSVANMADYDVILLGYPIWHGQAPRIISTFLESYDLTGKTIVPFCTSHSSGIGSSDTSLHALAGGASWLPGRRFPAGTTRSELAAWLDSLELPAAAPSGAPVFDFDTRTVMLNSGYAMPLNGLGTYSLRGDTCINAVKSALASGVRLIDTAHMYGNEAEIGQAVRESMEELGISREEIFVITKIYPGADMADPERAIQACLDRLDIGYVDMMLLHHPDPNDVKAYRAMEQFVEAGLIRSIGLSNWYAEELEEFLPQVAILPALVQNEIHPYYQENDVIPYIQSLGIVVQGWYPLGGRGHTAELLGDPVISGIAAAHGRSPAQIILRWNLQKGVVVIPGSSNPAHIAENAQLYDFELSEEEMEAINALDRNEKHDWY